MIPIVTNMRCDQMVLELYKAPVDPRTGNKAVYGASWIADRKSMIGQRNEDWVRRELEWFLSGSNSLHDMTPPVPQAFQACADPEGYVNSAYGHILFNQSASDDNRSLYDHALDAFFNEGLHTRHSVVIMSDRDIHAMATEGGKNDFICTNALNFMVDTDNRLHILAQMRSMDAVWGYRADYSMWDYLRYLMVKDLSAVYPEVRPGEVVFQVANLHVYPRHLEMLENEAHSIMEADMRKIWKDGK